MKKRMDYRHVIAIAITLGSLAMSIFVFPVCWYRLLQGVRDFIFSIGYYFGEIFEIDYEIPIPVTELPNLSDRFSNALTLPFLPESWEAFQEKWALYWQAFFAKENLTAYLRALGEFLLLFCRLLLIVFPFVLLFSVLIRMTFRTEVTDDYTESKALLFYRRTVEKAYRAIKQWILDFWAFLKESSFKFSPFRSCAYLRLWAIIWLYNFNVGAICFEFFAYYFYLIVSLDLKNLYIQIYKLLLDLSVAINFIPGIGWLVIGLWLFDLWRKKVGSFVLHMYLDRDEDFAKSLPVVVMLVGTMGAGKTKALTGLNLIQETRFRRKALDCIFDIEMRFPDFPFPKFERVLRDDILNHRIYTLATARQRIRYYRTYFSFASDQAVEKSIARHYRKIGKERPLAFREFLFGYDDTLFPTEYDDALTVKDLFDYLEEYAQYYLIYVLKSSLILANYGIRVDGIKSDLGNLPLWDYDFFDRPSVRQDDSECCHVLDFDLLRMGKKVNDENPYIGALEFGVIGISEVGKERGNMLENRGKEKNCAEANPLNDMTEKKLKMIRHNGTVGHDCFVFVGTDEQRASSWSADARELCLLVHLSDQIDKGVTLPLFFLDEMLCDWIIGKFERFQRQYRFFRSDKTLLAYLSQKFVSKVYDYYLRRKNRFGYEKQTVYLESGKQDGELTERVFYNLSKMIYSDRYATDAWRQSLATETLTSSKGLEDLPSYQAVRPSPEEFERQHSYFYSDLSRWGKEAEAKKRSQNPKKTR